MKSDIIVYCTHPVAPRVKAMVMANGHRIIDARFAPEGAQIIDGQFGTDAAAEKATKEEKPKPATKARTSKE